MATFTTGAFNSGSELAPEKFVELCRDFHLRVKMYNLPCTYISKRTWCPNHFLAKKLGATPSQRVRSREICEVKAFKDKDKLKGVLDGSFLAMVTFYMKLISAS